jgi:hypothetical protein
MVRFNIVNWKEKKDIIVPSTFFCLFSKVIKHNIYHMPQRIYLLFQHFPFKTFFFDLFLLAVFLSPFFRHFHFRSILPKSFVSIQINLIVLF